MAASKYSVSMCTTNGIQGVFNLKDYSKVILESEIWYFFNCFTGY